MSKTTQPGSKKAGGDSKKSKPPTFQIRTESRDSSKFCDGCDRLLEGTRNLCVCMKDIEFVPRSDDDMDL